MSKAFLIGIVIFLLGCSAGSLSVDATDYASLCKQAEQEGKNVVVLVTAALSCLSRIIAGVDGLPGMGRMAEGTCAVMSYGTFGYSELISPFTEYDGCPVSGGRIAGSTHTICPYRFYFGYKIETGNYRDREGACRIVYFE